MSERAREVEVADERLNSGNYESQVLHRLLRFASVITSGISLYGGKEGFGESLAQRHRHKEN